MEKNWRSTQLSRLNKCILVLACLWLVTLAALLIEVHQERTSGAPHMRYAVKAVNYQQA